MSRKKLWRIAALSALMLWIVSALVAMAWEAELLWGPKPSGWVLYALGWGSFIPLGILVALRPWKKGSGK